MKQKLIILSEPILAILSYGVYRFKFKENSNVKEIEYIGIGFNEVTGENTVNYKIVKDNVMILRQKEYFNKLMNVFMLKKYKLIHSQELNFSIQ